MGVRDKRGSGIVQVCLGHTSMHILETLLGVHHLPHTAPVKRTRCHTPCLVNRDQAHTDQAHKKMLCACPSS